MGIDLSRDSHCRWGGTSTLCGGDAFYFGRRPALRRDACFWASAPRGQRMGQHLSDQFADVCRHLQRDFLGRTIRAFGLYVRSRGNRPAYHHSVRGVCLSPAALSLETSLLDCGGVRWRASATAAQCPAHRFTTLRRRSCGRNSMVAGRGAHARLASAQIQGNYRRDGDVLRRCNPARSFRFGRGNASLSAYFLQGCRRSPLPRGCGLLNIV